MKTSTFSQFGCISDEEDRGRVAQLEPLFLIVKSAKGTGTQGVVMAECAVKAGMVKKTFQNQYYAWLKFGVMGCADKRKVAKVRAVPDILAVYKTYVERMHGDDHIHAAAHRRMMADFRMGKLFPGVGTWREVYRAEFGEGVQIPVSCPPRWIPYGWGYANLLARLNNDPTHLASLAWNLRGQYAASKFVMDVVRTRYDQKTRQQLAAGRVMQWDDAWENNLVMLPGCNGVYRPLGFHCYDIGTGFHLAPFMKPRTYSKVEGTDRVKGDNLTEQMFRMAFAYVHTVIGFSKQGVTHYLEKGTTAIRDNVRMRIAKIPQFGRMISFKTSAPMNTSAHKGLFAGSIGGNPRHKSTVEGGHRYRQLEMAHLPSNVGNTADLKPESLANMQKHEESFIAKFNEAQIPQSLMAVAKKLIPMWDEYYALACAVSDAINDTSDHKLEGWIDYHKQEFRDPDDPQLWHPIEMLDQLTPVTQERVAAMIQTDPANNVRSRRMSRREAWNLWVSRGELVKVPLSEMQAFLDPRDAKVLTVTPKRTIKFKDETYYGKGVEKVYRAVCTDRNGIPHMLAPGQQVRVYFNCWGDLQNHIWVADMDDKPIGQAEICDKAFWADQEQIDNLAKQKLIDQAQLLHDTASRHFDAAAEKVALEWSQQMLIKAGEVTKTERRVRADRVRVSSGAPAPALEDENPYAALS